MKAYKAWDEKAFEPCSTIVFAENIKEAKKIAMSTDVCEDARFIDIRVKRCKEADCLYKGSSEVDWDDEETRVALVRDFGWACYDTSFECESCEVREYCSWFEEDRKTSLFEINQQLGAQMENLRAENENLRSQLRYYESSDLVDVIRCKDCKYFSEFQHCGVLGFCEPNEYCSRGERRKEDDSIH